jgi:hypothetical protein
MVIKNEACGLSVFIDFKAKSGSKAKVSPSLEDT